MLRQSGLVLAIVVASCGAQPEGDRTSNETAPPELPNEVAPPLPVSPIQYFTPADCEPSGTYTPPAVGTNFDYDVADGAGRPVVGTQMRERVRATDGLRVDYDEIPISGGSPLAPGDRRSLYAAVAPGPAARRDYRFQPADIEQITAMRAGDELVLNGSETTNFETTRTIQGRWKIRLIGCGRTTDAIPGAANEPVRAYRLMNFYRSARPEGDVIRTGEIERLVSTRTGWRVLDREASGMTILASVSFNAG